MKFSTFLTEAKDPKTFNIDPDRFAAHLRKKAADRAKPVDSNHIYDILDQVYAHVDGFKSFEAKVSPGEAQTALNVINGEYEHHSSGGGDVCYVHDHKNGEVIIAVEHHGGKDWRITVSPQED